MDTNLLYWKTHGQSFFSRLKIWADLLDPAILLASQPEIRNARALLESEDGQQNEQATRLSLSSVHADSGSVLPLVCRPPALMPIYTPMVIASLLPHTTVKGALLCQFPFHMCMAGFTHANRSSSKEDATLSQMLIMAGTVSYATCAGSLPQIAINRLRIADAGVQTFLRNVGPVPISAALAAFSVYLIRSQEFETGIKVFDESGKLVGISPAAGQKAVRDTAVSRAVMMGSTAAIPQLLVFLSRRTRLFQKFSLLLTPLRHISTLFVFGLMIPVSLSLFPQLGTIKKESLEKELWDAASDSQLFYHRGV